MSDRWIKPDFQEIGVGGECTAYAGTKSACETQATENKRNVPEVLATPTPPSQTLPAG
ncbi:MAG TPA: pyrroloquinoline quinone precursor peptide PqqA [Gemmataceae bacterium]